ncbi:E3 ubiquitin-protein ligase E3D isoform X2 [Rhinichthys klamathensis goyatoka]|uniref:E3 ubiquitin-protein ligase E3D isoform X2 n=1 Tax=Rhinichthys klamathensis goyatoka TaxID=3034132 RepID=UPI0024B5865F|nr:E3 ubiquitin-protein ligase E3D isoform X2 [Rhinichthys klamathensis goyatoka]
MEDTAKQDLVFLELRRKLQSGILFISGDIAREGADVKVESQHDSLLNIQTADGSYQVNLTPGVSLVETSRQRSPGFSERGSHFRLRLRVEQESEAPRSVIGRLRVNVTYSFQCQSCGSMVLQDRAFGRVLPLPNGNWNALVDDWCCHPDPFANRKLLPRDGDCLLGDTFILLARDISCEQTLTREGNLSQKASAEKRVSKRVMLSCTSCSAVLGEELSAEVLKFYITEILVKPGEDGGCDITRLSLEPKSDSIRQRFLEQTLASRLVELSSAQSIFRFSIQTPDSTAVILLWLLNTDTLVASFPGESFISTVDVHPREHQSCQAVQAVKVLYVLCSDSKLKDVVDVWEKDISVHPLPLPQSSCEELQKLLMSSTSRLPAFLRCMNSYQVAYMRM